MAFETKEEIFEKVISQEKPKCPHCDQEMSLWEVPDIAVDDGLGWGTPYLFICFNNECTLYSSGWDNIRENYGRTASYRCMCYPDSGNYECMPVWGPQGGQGQIIDDEALEERDRLKRKTEKGFAVLAECAVSEDGIKVVRILLDPDEPNRVRIRAAEMAGNVAGLEAIDPLRNHKYGNEILRKKVEEVISKIHQKHFTRECPFCAEVVKQQAKLCKHCGQEIAGQ